MATRAGTPAKKGGGLGRVLREEFKNPERRTAYYMVLPTLLVILAVAFYPIMVSLSNSFRLSIPGQPGGEWAGPQNYGHMFQDRPFQSALTNTTVFTVASVALEFVIGLAIALA